MKLLAAVLFICLLVTGTVSAISLSPGSVQSAKVVVTTTTTQIPKIPAAVIPGAVATVGGQGTVEVYSNPSGAAISLSGVSQPGEKTPMKYANLPPGSYTVVLSLAGYRDYTETFTLTSGAIMDIQADLKPGISASAMGVAVASPANWITVNLDSVPPNATVSDMGSGAFIGTTPLRLHLSPGMHYVTVSAPFYQNQSLRFNQSQDIMVTLVRNPVGAGVMGQAIVTGQAVVTGQTIVPTGTIGWQSGIAPLNPGLSPGNYAGGVVSVPTTPMTYVDCTGTWICLTPAQAEQQFGDSWARKGDTPCGLEETGSPLAALKYCYQDAPSWSLPAGVLDAADIADGDNIYIMNRTWIERAVVKRSPAVQETGTANTNPFQSFLDFLSGIVSGSSKPESRLDIVGFNPCPEPPGMPIPPDAARVK